MPVESIYNERELITRVAGGDEAAFRHLFGQYYGLIYSVAFRYIKVHEIAEDVVQQSFLKIWEKRAGLDAIGRFDAYLFVIARNEIIDTLRRQSRHARYLRRMRELFEEEDGSPEDLLISKQKRLVIQDAVNGLPRQQQLAYRLSRDKGLSYEEIAASMGLSVHTVRGHISAALNTIRSFISAHKNDLYVLLASLLLSGH